MSLDFAKLKKVDPRELRNVLDVEGSFLLEGVASPEFCRGARKFIDGYRGEITEVLYSGSELRIWDAERRNAELQVFHEGCLDWLQAALGERIQSKTLLAIRNKALLPNDRESRRGRWHTDSFFRQLKIFLFLTDTSESSGPFELIPGSHRPSFKLRMLTRGTYFKLSDLLRRRRSYQHIDESVVEGLEESGYRTRPILCPAGTLAVVNTSAIHRARPCLTGSRYALTAYYV